MAAHQKRRLTRCGGAANIQQRSIKGYAMPETAPLKAFWQPG